MCVGFEGERGRVETRELLPICLCWSFRGREIERERYRLGVCVSRDLFLGTPFICLCGHGIERISRVWLFKCRLLHNVISPNVDKCLVEYNFSPTRLTLSLFYFYLFSFLFYFFYPVKIMLNTWIQLENSQQKK